MTERTDSQGNADEQEQSVSVDYRSAFAVPKWVREVIDESFAIEQMDAR